MPDLEQCTVDIYEDIVKSYYSTILNYCYFPSLNEEVGAKCVYTSMHGVGYQFVTMAFKAFKLNMPIPVVEQVS